MDFAQFYQAISMGGFVLIAGILAWAVKELLRVSQVTTRLEIAVTALQAESKTCEIERRASDGAYHALDKSVALLAAALADQGKTLAEIRDHILRKPATTRTRTTTTSTKG